MKIGFNLLLWTTHLDDELLGVCEQLKAAGYDGVEVPIFEGTPAHYANLKRQLGDIGLATTVVGIVQSAEANPSSPDAASHQAGVDYLKWLVDCSAELGAQTLCGPFYQPLAEFSGSGPTAEEWDAIVSAHQAMANHAKGTGVALSVEPLNRFECYALNTIEAASNLVDAVGVENYGLLYDTFHQNIEENDPIAALKAAGSRINHVHISENNRGTPGRGQIDFDAVFAALKSINYDGWLTIEAFGHALPDIAAATKVWRPLFESREQVYSEGIALIRNGWANA
jgi:D-psicose/D-tagatose/L-ribulose 3-epimerase